MSEETFNMFYCYETGARTEVDFFEWHGTQEEAQHEFKTACALYQTLLWAELKNVSRGDIIVDEVVPRQGG
jgi:hypothetical protein